MSRVSAIVVSHGHARELETLLPALAPQVDELVVIANAPGSVPQVLSMSGHATRILENQHPLRLAQSLFRSRRPPPNCKRRRSRCGSFRKALPMPKRAVP